MSENRTYNDVNPFKIKFMGDEAKEYNLVIQNKSETKNLFDSLTKIKFNAGTTVNLKITGKLAYLQFLSNIEQLNFLNNNILELTDNSNSSSGGENTGGSGSTGTVVVDGITVSPKTKTIDPSKTFQITATVDPENATNKNVVWFSEDESIATVDANGLVTAVKSGKVKITAMAQDGGFKANTQVTIRSSVTSITLSSDKTQVTSTDTQQVTAVVSPTDATDSTVTWSSSNTAKATVDANGLVTAGRTTGDVVITATANDGSNVTGTITLTITAPAV